MAQRPVTRTEWEGFNSLLCKTLGENVRLSAILYELGFDQDQVETLKNYYLRDILDFFVLETFEKMIVSRSDGERIWYILSSRHGLMGHSPKTLQSLGKELGISRERVRQLEKKGVRLLNLLRKKQQILEKFASVVMDMLADSSRMPIKGVPTHTAINSVEVENERASSDRMNRVGMQSKSYALNLLRQMIGEDHEFRPGQWEAIEAVAIQKQRVLVVQRTGWGKSLVYFLATKLLREQGSGPTLLISPLLSLMRNQIEMAIRIGIRAYTINSTNREDWGEVDEALANDACDLILISPERLNNEHFLKEMLPKISGRIGLFVVDEAHCISDWGHDFRPDYRRIVRIIQMLPQAVPVLGTTATANNRVIADVQSQLGPGLVILRGPLVRESLFLQNIRLSSQSERLAWIAEALNLKLLENKSGIIYCLTVADTERVTGWLQHKGFKAEAYHAGNEREIDRSLLEQLFLRNEIRILVATVALGMGFDKPDVDFVIHFQRPGSVVAYYQQVGRAGREVKQSYGILLNGAEDDEIQNYFIESAFPPIEVLEKILGALETREDMSMYEILAQVNASRPTVEKALKVLEVDGAVGQLYDKTVRFFRTPNHWKPDIDRINRVLDLRRAELGQIQEYVDHAGCLMQFLLAALDDPNPVPCGHCANCKQKAFSSSVSQELITEAETFLKGSSVLIRPHKRWPVGLFPGQKFIIPGEYQNAPGRSLCYYGDAGWGKLVRSGKYQQDHFDDELVTASAQMVKETWCPDPFPFWVTAIPSNRHPELVPDFAARLAQELGIQFIPVLHRIGATPEQKSMQNSTMQARNVIGTLAVDRIIPETPVLLVDDIIDSGWTLTMAGYLLRSNGSGLVYPFTLAQATARNGSG